jgi:hypothetical protein
MNKTLNAPEPSQDHLHDTSEGPPRDPPSEPNDAEANTSEAPQQHADTTTDSSSRPPDEPLNDEEL